MTNVNGMSSKIIDSILMVFGLIIVGLLFGSFGYTWSVDSEQSKEKQVWRQQHQTDHKRELDEIRQDIRDMQKQSKEELKEKHEEIKQLLLEIVKQNKKNQGR